MNLRCLPCTGLAFRISNHGNARYGRFSQLFLSISLALTPRASYSVSRALSFPECASVKHDWSRALLCRSDRVPVELPLFDRKCQSSEHDYLHPFTTICGSMHCSSLWVCDKCKSEHTLMHLTCTKCHQGRNYRSKQIGFWQCTTCSKSFTDIYSRCPTCETSIIKFA